MKSIVAIGGGDTFEENEAIHRHIIELYSTLIGFVQIR
jgi:hypothetical protein